MSCLGAMRDPRRNIFFPPVCTTLFGSEWNLALRRTSREVAQHVCCYVMADECWHRPEDRQELHAEVTRPLRFEDGERGSGLNWFLRFEPEGGQVEKIGRVQHGGAGEQSVLYRWM